MTWLETVIIAIVEGLTEFLPVSSTGHMIITQNLLGIEQGDPFVHAFTFIIQFGAILSVVCLYWKRFFKLDNTPAPEGASLWQCLKHKYYFYWLLIVGVLPAVIIGFILMSGGSSTEEAYNPDIFSARRIKVAPLVCLLGFVSMVYAVVHKSKD